MTVHVEVISHDELNDRITAIRAEHPGIGEYTVDCCSGCCEDDVRRDLGPDAAEAWNEMRTLLWLAGDG
jgi:hypothetical protein